MSWLDELKVGDKIIVVSSYCGTKDTAIRKVERITPSRQMVISGYAETKFKNGSKMGESGSWGTHTYLIEWSQEQENKIRIDKRCGIILHHLSSFKYDKLTIEDREEIFRIVSKYGKVQGLPPK